MRTLIIRGLRDRRRATATWALALGAAGGFYMLLWPAVDDTIAKAIGNYPDSIKAAFGVGRLSDANEFLSVEQFSLILPFALGVFAIRRVAGAINGAQERGFLDVLLSAPVSRRTITIASFAIIAVELAVVLAVAWAITCVASAASGAGLDEGLAAAGFGNVWALAIFAAGMAMLITGVTRHAGTVTGAASGTLIAMYLVDLVTRLSDSVDALGYLSVFRYYGAAGVDGIDPLRFVGMVGAGLLLAALGSRLFDRRDLAGV